MSNNRSSEELDRLAGMFKALANPQRLRLLLRLTSCCDPPIACCRMTPAGVRRCVGDLSKDLGVAASTVSHHLKELRQTGLMRVERCGQRIECWINDDAVRLLATFLDDASPPANAPPPEKDPAPGRKE